MGKKIITGAKKIAVKTLAFIFKNSKNAGAITRLFFLPLIVVFKTSSRLLFIVAIPLYKIYLSTKRIFIRFYSPFLSKHKLLHPFTRRYLSHGIVIMISLFVVSTNLNAFEVKRDDLTYSNVFTSIIKDEELGTIEKDSLQPRSHRVTRYVGTSNVESKPQTSGDFLIDVGAGRSVSTGALIKPILSPTEAELRRRDKVVYHAVRQGQTISEIAQTYGVSVNTILWENNLTAYTIIRPEQNLAILPTSGIAHKVAGGDTVEKIAKKYKAEPEDIIEFNKLASADDINRGERLIIPGGVKPPPPRTYTIRAFTAPQVQATVLIAGKLAWPATCHRITQYFNAWRHKGIDIACSFASPVKAALSGTVIEANGGWNGGYGLMVSIEHGDKQTLYSHLSKIYVSVGDEVTAGQAIGAMGSTGRSTGSHVHFELRSGGWVKNPLDYL